MRGLARVPTTHFPTPSRPAGRRIPCCEPAVPRPLDRTVSIVAVFKLRRHRSAAPSQRFDGLSRGGRGLLGGGFARGGGQPFPDPFRNRRKRDTAREGMSERDVEMIRGGARGAQPARPRRHARRARRGRRARAAAAVLEGTVYRGHAGLRRWLDGHVGGLGRLPDRRERGTRPRGGPGASSWRHFHARGSSSGVQLDCPRPGLC